MAYRFCSFLTPAAREDGISHVISCLHFLRQASGEVHPHGLAEIAGLRG